MSREKKTLELERMKMFIKWDTFSHFDRLYLLSVPKKEK